MSIGVIILLIIIVALAVGFVVLYAKQYRKVAPNEVLVISGRKSSISIDEDVHKEIGYSFRVGGGAFLNPMTERAETLLLEVTTVNIKTPEVLTKGGVPILAEAVAQVKIDTADLPLSLAIEQFLGKGHEAIGEVAQAILEGKMRSVIGSMTIEHITTNRLLFAEKVEEAVHDEFGQMGLVLLSFSLTDISDTQGYLDALGLPQIAQAKRDAVVAQAEADRDAAIQSAEARRESEIARLKAEAKIAATAWENESLKAKSQVEVNTQKAHADMSYELERHKIEQSIKKEEFLVRKIEQENAIKLQELEIDRKSKELEATILKPAEAKKQQVMAEAEAEKFRLATEAEGRTTARKLEVDAEQERILKTGKAEAQAMAEKAQAFASYNEAAVTQMLVDVLPQIASSVSEPLSRVEKIVLVGTDGESGASKITGQVADVISQLPEVVESLTGIDLKKALKSKLEKESDR